MELKVRRFGWGTRSGEMLRLLAAQSVPAHIKEQADRNYKLFRSRVDTLAERIKVVEDGMASNKRGNRGSR